MTEKQSKGIKGGKRPGAGRKKGVPNKRTSALQKEVEDSGLTPLQYLLARMRDLSADPRDRMTAAISAAPYVHAKLSSIDLKADISTHEASLEDLA
jgi:hypothetical protein